MFASYNTDYEANCIAQSDPSPERPVGPCITSVLDMRDQKNPLEGFVVEDCAIPLALGPLLFPMMEYLPDPIKPTYGPARTIAKVATRVAGRLFGPYFTHGSIARTPTYLIMSHDSKLSQ